MKHGMIAINYFNINDNQVYDYLKLMKSIPFSMQEHILSYRMENDRKRSLFGKLVLKKMLMEWGYPDDILESYRTDSNNRPYINDEIDFNISHSEDFAICAVSNSTKIGIDIEKIKLINIEEIQGLIFNEEEKKRIECFQLEQFYDIWTLKEAVLKANGGGLNLSMKKVNISENGITCCDEEWKYSKLNINRNYAAHLVYKENSIVSISEISSF